MVACPASGLPSPDESASAMGGQTSNAASTEGRAGTPRRLRSFTVEVTMSDLQTPMGVRRHPPDDRVTPERTPIPIPDLPGTIGDHPGPPPWIPDLPES
jgi:hypothetical protein